MQVIILLGSWGGASSSSTTCPGSGREEVFGRRAEMRTLLSLPQVGGGKWPPRFEERVLGVGFKGSRCASRLLHLEDPYYFSLSRPSSPSIPSSLQAQNQGPRGRSRDIREIFAFGSHILPTRAVAQGRFRLSCREVLCFAEAAGAHQGWPLCRGGDC